MAMAPAGGCMQLHDMFAVHGRSRAGLMDQHNLSQLSASGDARQARGVWAQGAGCALRKRSGTLGLCVCERLATAPGR